VTLRFVDVSEPDSAPDSALLEVPVVAVGPLANASEFWLQQATFTLTEDDADDPGIDKLYFEDFHHQRRKIATEYSAEVSGQEW